MTKYKIYKLEGKYFVKVKGWFFYYTLGHSVMWGRGFKVEFFPSEERAEKAVKTRYGQLAKRVTKPRLV